MTTPIIIIADKMKPYIQILKTQSPNSFVQMRDIKLLVHLKKACDFKLSRFKKISILENQPEKSAAARSKTKIPINTIELILIYT